MLSFPYLRKRCIFSGLRERPPLCISNRGFQSKFSRCSEIDFFMHRNAQPSAIRAAAKNQPSQKPLELDFMHRNAQRAAAPWHAKALFSAPLRSSRRCALELRGFQPPFSAAPAQKSFFMHNDAQCWRPGLARHQTPQQCRRTLKTKGKSPTGKAPDHCETNPIQNPPACPKLPTAKLLR
jgi:hypothetical protein